MLIDAIPKADATKAFLELPISRGQRQVEAMNGYVKFLAAQGFASGPLAALQREWKTPVENKVQGRRQRQIDHGDCAGENRYRKTNGIPGSVFFFFGKTRPILFFARVRPGVWSLRPCAQTAASPPAPALPPRPRPPAPLSTAPHPPPPPLPAPAAQIGVSPA